MATLLERLDDIVRPIVDELGLELYDLDFAGGTIRVTIDKEPADGEPVAIDLADITAVTRAVSRALDEHDPIPDRYSLEVSSPGLERALRTPRHFERAVGQTLAVKTVPTSGLDRRLTGQLVRAGEVTAGAATSASAPSGSGVDTIDLRGEDGEVRTIAYADIDKARTVFEWGPEPRPSKPKNKPKAGTAAGAATKPKKPKKKKVDAS